MPRTIEVQLYQFDELDDAAKEKARNWYRGCGDGDDFWSENVLDDAATAMIRCGFDVMQGRAKLMDGTTRPKAVIYWSGFSSQGDGACFEASWAPKKIMSIGDFACEYPGTWTGTDGKKHESKANLELQRIHAESVRLAGLDPTNGISWRCKPTNRGSHEHAVTFEHWDEREQPQHCEDETDKPCDGTTACGCDCDLCQFPATLDNIEEEHEENARGGMRWIYRQLETEYEWQNSDEVVDDNIRANEYTFTASGKREG